MLSVKRQARGVDQRGPGINVFGDVTWTRKNKALRSKSPEDVDSRPNAVQMNTTTSEDASDSDDDDDDDDESEITTPIDIKPESERRELDKKKHGSVRVRDLLEHWDEPVNKMDKVC